MRAKRFRSIAGVGFLLGLFWAIQRPCSEDIDVLHDEKTSQATTRPLGAVALEARRPTTRAASHPTPPAASSPRFDPFKLLRDHSAVRGRFVDASHRPLSGHVFAYDFRSPGQIDHDGRFRIFVPPPVSPLTVVYLSPAGDVRAAFEFPGPFPATEIDVGEIVVSERSSLSILVLDRDARPIPNAVATWSSGVGEVSRPTDEFGATTIPIQKSRRLWVVAPGYAFYESRLVAESLADPTTVVLEPATGIEVVVDAEKGVDIRGLSIRCDSASPILDASSNYAYIAAPLLGPGYWTARNATSISRKVAEDSVFRAFNLKAGVPIDVSLVDDVGRVLARTTTRLVDEKTTRVELRVFGMKRSLEVRCRDVHGHPLSGVRIALDVGFTGRADAYVSTDDQGTARFTDLRQVEARLTAIKDGFAMIYMRPILLESEMNGVSLELESGRTLRGRTVGLDGRPSEGGLVYVREPSGVTYPIESEDVLDAPGEFIVEHAPSADFVLVIERSYMYYAAPVKEGETAVVLTVPRDGVLDIKASRPFVTLGFPKIRITPETPHAQNMSWAESLPIGSSPAIDAVFLSKRLPAGAYLLSAENGTVYDSIYETLFEPMRIVVKEGETTTATIP